jgi:hypothetical protein
MLQKYLNKCDRYAVTTRPAIHSYPLLYPQVVPGKSDFTGVCPGSNTLLVDKKCARLRPVTRSVSVTLK